MTTNIDVRLSVCRRVDFTVTPAAPCRLVLTPPPPQKAMAHVLGFDWWQRCVPLSEPMRIHKVGEAERLGVLPHERCASWFNLYFHGKHYLGF
jgi:hypothetical protein